MSDNGKTGVLMIKTAEKQEEIISNGMVTWNMRLNLDRVSSECKYVICCQDNPDDAEDLFTDNSAYLIGIIKDVRKLPNNSAVIYLSEFATIYREGMWAKRHGMPVQYFASPTECGMYAGRVNFKPVNDTLTSTMLNVANGTSEIAEPIKTPIVTMPTPKVSFPTSDFRTTLAASLSIKPKNVESAMIVLKLDDGTKVTLEL